MVLGGMRAPGRREGSQDYCLASPTPLGTLLASFPDIDLKNCTTRSQSWIHLVPAGECLEHGSTVEPAVDGLPQLPRPHQRVLQLGQATSTTAPHYQIPLQVSVQEETLSLSPGKCLQDFPWAGPGQGNSL